VPRSTRNKVYVLLAPGFEEGDVSTVTRTLRRSGFRVAVVGLTAGSVRGAYGLSLAPDRTLSEVETEHPRAIVLPGAIHAARQLNSDPRVHTLLRRVAGQGGYVVAFDAAYTVLRSAGLVANGEASGEDTARAPLPRWRSEGLPSERVLVEGPVIFGRDSGAAQEAALTLVSLLES
jgi:4-methyl-5(b-hydroxyethyl)-thiazole monophosphate biosynthesis